MSLWHCPQHGLTGPIACCSGASLANVATVVGLEMTCLDHRGTIDEDRTLARCPFCDHTAGFYDSTDRGDKFPIGVVCTNTSCGIKTPQHYRDRQTAALAWNRRTSTSEGNEQ